MTDLFAALPMYDWPEVRADTDAEWASIRRRLESAGIEAPEQLVRRNKDMPAVPGGITDANGRVIAPDPAALPPDEFDLATMWRHPKLLLSQTCWGPMEATGLADLVSVVFQPDYASYEGGEDDLYSSAVVVRLEDAAGSQAAAGLPLEFMRGRRLAFNDAASLSGMLALTRDLEALGETLDVFSELFESGSHRASIRAIAEGRADVATIDCRSLALARRVEPAVDAVAIVGWTQRRKGLPYITGQHDLAGRMRAALAGNDG